jgi:Cytochrome c.
MITKRTIALVAALAATPALADHPPVAHQGGRLAEAHGHRMELVTGDAMLEILLKDAHNQPLSAAGYAGKAILMAPGGKAEVPLRPDGQKLVGTLPPGGQLAAAIVALKASDGHAMNARFPALQPAPAPSPDLAAQGRTVYEAQCVSCHGDRLQGQAGWQMQTVSGSPKLAPPLDATGHGWQHSDEQLAEVIRNGSDPMPSFAAVLAEQDIQAVIAYFKASWPIATLAQQPASRPASSGGGHQHH